MTETRAGMRTDAGLASRLFGRVDRPTLCLVGGVAVIAFAASVFSGWESLHVRNGRYIDVWRQYLPMAATALWTVGLASVILFGAGANAVGDTLRRATPNRAALVSGLIFFGLALTNLAIMLQQARFSDGAAQVRVLTEIVRMALLAVVVAGVARICFNRASRGGRE